MKYTKKCVLIPYEKYERMMKTPILPEKVATPQTNREVVEENLSSIPTTAKKRKVQTGEGAPPPGLPDVTKSERMLEEEAALHPPVVATPPHKHKKKKKTETWKALWQSLT